MTKIPSCLVGMGVFGPFLFLLFFFFFGSFLASMVIMAFRRGVATPLPDA